MTDTDGTVDHVIDAELRLLRPEVRRDADEVARLLHPGFVEIGSSGRRWSREEMLAALGGMFTEADRPRAREVEAARLAESVVLVTYLTEHPGRRVRRGSLWLRDVDGAWRLSFHQGTVVPGADERP
ncbi:nuclear transport factor 2 family protein [Saccharomonospora halophila]|uniref:nuclear transport factor 2 family protein n=1 Tax=Saccharomonospora halophila TaxID=129922 RepID=UPI000374D5B2|nr:nuclear transport factor 2 family protein [Saccharomonospora halophila]